MAYHCLDGSPMPFPVPGRMWDPALGERLYAERMRYIRRVDELGFDGIIFTEHHYGPNGGLTPSPTVMLSAATQVTERIKLVTMGIALALYPHPVRMAEELAMIDNLSHGRLVVGFISSGAQNLFAYSVPVEEERGRYHEAYDLMVKAWTEPEPFEWHSQYYNYECISILPRPLQQPHPPIWTTATAAESIQWAAQNRIRFISHGPTPEAAERLSYYRSYAEQECGWTPADSDVAIAREFYIAPTRAKFDEMLERQFGRRRGSSYRHRDESPYLRPLNEQRREVRTYDYLTTAARPFAGAAWDEEGINSGQFLAGDPDTLAEEILKQRKTTGANVLVIRPEMDPASLDEIAEGLALFSREVLPILKKA
jgi:alkanesulfonate monooxygenase SsuD/methylene tetrahydromethanopterin reductase-like flavin-dependent oxidoreductase (luciferase family)